MEPLPITSHFWPGSLKSALDPYSLWPCFLRHPEVSDVQICCLGGEPDWNHQIKFYKEFYKVVFHFFGCLAWTLSMDVKFFIRWTIESHLETSDNQCNPIIFLLFFLPSFYCSGINRFFLNFVHLLERCLHC